VQELVRPAKIEKETASLGLTKFPRLTRVLPTEADSADFA